VRRTAWFSARTVWFLAGTAWIFARTAWVLVRTAWFFARTAWLLVRSAWIFARTAWFLARTAWFFGKTNPRFRTIWPTIAQVLRHTPCLTSIMMTDFRIAGRERKPCRMIRRWRRPGASDVGMGADTKFVSELVFGRAAHIDRLPTVKSDFES
jgi:hypothetical protein